MLYEVITFNNVSLFVTGDINTMDNIYQTIDDSSSSRQEQDIGRFVMHHIPRSGIIIQLSEQWRQFTNRNIFHRNNTGDDFIACARMIISYNFV